MTTILLIDDNPLLVELYKTVFENHGVKVFFANDGETGIEIAKTKKPSLILLDMLMVGMDAFSVLKALKANRNTKKVKIVILTIVNDEESRKKAAKYGADAYLLKSEMTTEEMAKKVLSFLK